MAGAPCPGPTTYRASRPVLRMILLSCAYTITRPGQVPQWPKRRGLIWSWVSFSSRRTLSLRNIIAKGQSKDMRCRPTTQRIHACSDIVGGPSKELNSVEVIFVEIILRVELDGQVEDAFWDEGDFGWGVWFFDELSRHSEMWWSIKCLDTYREFYFGTRSK